MTREERIALARRFIEHAPAAQSAPPDLMGWNGLGVNVCVDCSGRIIGRGCDFTLIATKAVWKPATIQCDVCKIDGA